MPLAGCASLVTRFLVQASSRLHAASLRNPSQSVRKPTTWFQLGVIRDPGPEISNGLGASLYAEASEPRSDCTSSERFKPSPWVAPIEGYLIGKTRVRVTDILTDCLEVSKARQSQKDMNEVVRCLQHLG